MFGCYLDRSVEGCWLEGFGNKRTPLTEQGTSSLMKNLSSENILCAIWKDNRCTKFS